MHQSGPPAFGPPAFVAFAETGASTTFFAAAVFADSAPAAAPNVARPFATVQHALALPLQFATGLYLGTVREEDEDRRFVTNVLVEEIWEELDLSQRVQAAAARLSQG